MIIYNYGLFWDTDNVFWGTQRNEGNIWGIHTRERKSDKIDFREQSGIYALYADYDLVYLGQTGKQGQKLLFRLKQHRRDALAKRWNKFSWFGTRQVLNVGELKAEKSGAHSTHREILNHMEAILISVSEPPLNRQGGKWGKEVEQYLQIRDERLGLSVQKMVEEIWKKTKDEKDNRLNNNDKY